MDQIKLITLDKKTGKPLTGENHAIMTRCLAVLLVNAKLMDDLLEQAERCDTDASMESMYKALLNLSSICLGDGQLLRADTNALAALLGCEVSIVSIAPEPDPAHKPN